MQCKYVNYLFREIVSYKRNVQNNKQYLSALLRRAKEKRLEPYTIPSPPSSTGAALGASSDETNEESKVETVSKINPKWTQEELLLGVEGMYSNRNTNWPTAVPIQKTKLFRFQQAYASLARISRSSPRSLEPRLNPTCAASSSIIVGNITWTPRSRTTRLNTGLRMMR